MTIVVDIQFGLFELVFLRLIRARKKSLTEKVISVRSEYDR